MNLDHYLNTATMRGVDFSQCPLKKFDGSKINKSATRSVVEDILTFYLAESGMALLANSVSRKQELTEKQNKLAKMYMDVCAEVGPHIFYYLMHVCIRENRHANSTCKSNSDKKMALTERAHNFMSKVRQISDRTEIRLYVDNESYNHATPDIKLGELSDAVWGYFYYGKWSSSFGGKKWGDVAKILQKYVHGEINTGLMIDQSANAVHNNGPIFNKHLVYKTPSSTELYRVLDVQRAGEIIPYVKSRVCKTVKQYHIEMLRIILAAVVDPTMDTVNWSAVESSGVKKGYVKKYMSAKKLKDGVLVEDAGDPEGTFSMGCYGSVDTEERINE